MMEKWNRRDRRSARWKEKREAWPPLLYKLALGIKCWYVKWRRGSFKTSWFLQHSSFLTHYGAYRRRHFHFSTTHSTSHHHELNTTFFLLSLLCALAFLVRAQTPSDNFNEINRRKSKARKRVCMQKKIFRTKQWEEFLFSLIDLPWSRRVTARW